MAVCKICGEYITGDMKACPKCATPISADYDYAKDLQNIKDVYQKFEEDMGAFVNRSKLTYICSLCGGVNHIDKKRCYRCGKPRPRSEYIKALKLLKKKSAPEEDVFEKLDEINRQAEEGRLNKPDLPPPVESLSEQQARLGAGSSPFAPPPFTQPPAGSPVLYRYEPGAAQTRPIAQPFVIVPYVNPAQPLLQYNPQQLYRFEPATYMEDIAKKEAQQAFYQGPQPTPSDLALLRAKRLEEIDELTRKIKELAYFKQDAEKMRRRKRGRRKG